MIPAPTYHWGSAEVSHTQTYLLSPLISLLPPAPLRILDLGCGNGWLTHWLREQSYEVVGVDPSASGVALARQTYPQITFHAVPATPDLLRKIQDDPFDLVISTEVVEHCYAPRNWAAACYNSLRPGGALICSTPYHGYLKNLTLALTGKLDAHFTALWDGGHIKFWSRTTLSQLLGEVGFVDLQF
jgi:2-polyprenyl-6-hydroxyphenyl methylase/3-demethylubiquinone-9 3-methyltransferase